MATKQYADINGLTEFYDGIVQKISDDLASYYTKTQVDSLISAITTLDIEVVQTLPTQDISQTTIYLVPKSTAQTSNTYDEYINTDGTSAGWELIGSTAIDLSGYVQKSQTAGLLKNDGTVDTVPKASQASVNAILDGTNIDSFGDVETALNGKMTNYNINNGLHLYVDAETGITSLQADRTSSITQGSNDMPTSDAVYDFAFPRSEQAVLGAKNRIGILFSRLKAQNTTGTWTGNTYEMDGVTFECTVDSAGYVTNIRANGTASSSHAQIDYDLGYSVSNGSYKLNGAPVGGGSLQSYNWFLGLYKTNTSSGNNLAYDFGDGADVNLSFSEPLPNLYIRVGIANGKTITNGDFKPMLSFDGGEYAPYAMTNEQLTNAVVTTFTGTTAEWNALTSAQKSAYTIVNLTDDFVYSRLSDIYSTDERVVGVWIDGKPLYQKTIDCGIGPAPATNKTVQVNAANVDKVIYVDGIATKSTTANPLPFLHNSDYGYVTQLDVRNITETKFDISIYNGTLMNLTTYNIYVTVRYTKTTD